MLQNKFLSMSDESVVKCIKYNNTCLFSLLLIGSVRALQKDVSLDEALVMSEKQFESQEVRVGGSELCNVCCFSFMVPRLQSQQRLTVARLRH